MNYFKIFEIISLKIRQHLIKKTVYVHQKKKNNHR